jgi:hypothetical protein
MKLITTLLTNPVSFAFGQSISASCLIPDQKMLKFSLKSWYQKKIVFFLKFFYFVYKEETMDIKRNQYFFLSSKHSKKNINLF